MVTAAHTITPAHANSTSRSRSGANRHATIPANTQWYIIWDFGTGPRRYVAAKSDNAGALSYEYGHVGPPAGVPPDPDANRPFRDGGALG